MSPSMLDSIPGEIHAMIAKLLDDRRDINNLCQVSKILYEKTVPYLYRSISLYALEDEIEDIFGSGLDEAGERGLLRHTRDIKLWSHFHEKTSFRCMHMNQEKYDIYRSEQEEVVEFVAEQLEILLGYCETGAIRSLDWTLGTCVPQSLLGPTGYFPLKQQNLETIRLVTDARCEWNVDYQDYLALSVFPHLKCLSWTGLSSPSDLESLADVLEQRSHQLEELEIDITHHRDLWSDYDSDNEREQVEFAVQILKLPRRRFMRFPVLKKLALAAVSVAPGNSRAVRQRVLGYIHDVFDFGSLQSLKLRHCHGWEDLIILLSKGAEPLELRSLEIQWSFKDAPTKPYESISEFLDKVHGLEELFLYTTAAEDSLGPWRALLRHRTSLRRVVHHQRSIDLSDDDHLFGTEYDSPDLAFMSPEDEEDSPGGSLGKLDLTCLGISCNARFMRSFVSGFASKTSLQVLHMRQSGTDLVRHHLGWDKPAERNDELFDFAGIELPVERFPMIGNAFIDFAQWVFGPTGICSLRLLVYGDFSYEGRFGNATLLLCRRDSSRGTEDSADEEASQVLRFREVKEGEDAELWGLFEREKHVLTACPCDSLFHV
ncbi:hypothetical protein BKA56DRAFT_593007 [Ilyonectria sp. MPI-CAGE-AT-0026]|nr:hypothetical protein BKA56DRAFT_593007 [Ilyonectria sp. MPI-CAGE-AT-0026]